MQTLRRLNDRERYYGLTWRGWLALGLAGGLVYGAVRLSPLGVRPTITIAALALAFGGALLHALSGQALGPGAHLLALLRYKLRPKRLELPGRPLRGGLVLAEAPRGDEGPPIGELSVEDEAA
jgi:hypothetical protein